MNRIRKVELPEEMMPDPQMVEDAKEADKDYADMYKMLRETLPELNATETIALMAQYFTERLALLIGENINDYDKSVLRGVVERHIASVLFVE